MASESTEAHVEPSPLEWKVQPWRGRGLALVVVGAVYAALWVYVAVWERDGFWGVLLVLAAWYVLFPLVVPVRYRLDAEGVTRTTRLVRSRRLPWSRFSGYRVGDDGRSIVLRSGSGPARWLTGDMSLFVPDSSVAAQAVQRLEFWMAPAGERP